jgi:hypothetical protein
MRGSTDRPKGWIARKEGSYLPLPSRISLSGLAVAGAAAPFLVPVRLSEDRTLIGDDLGGARGDDWKRGFLNAAWTAA